MASKVFSGFNKYSWFFTINYNPTSLSCIAVSEGDARQSILEFLSKIDSITAEYRRQLRDGNYDKAYELMDSFPDFHEFADLNIGCYTSNITDYHLDMLITNGQYQDVTLRDFITNEKPKVNKFNTVSVFSCLDG